MRMWNGLRIHDIVYFNNEKNKEYTVLELYEKNSKHMCRIQSIEDRRIIIETSVASCNRKIWLFFSVTKKKEGEKAWLW